MWRVLLTFIEKPWLFLPRLSYRYSLDAGKVEKTVITGNVAPNATELLTGIVTSTSNGSDTITNQEHTSITCLSLRRGHRAQYIRPARQTHRLPRAQCQAWGVLLAWGS